MRSEIWRTRDSQGPIQAMRTQEPSYPFRWHHHDDVELFVPEEGHGLVLVGDYTGEFGPGDAFLLSPFVPHSFYTVDRPAFRRQRLVSRIVNFLREPVEALLPEGSGLSQLLSLARRGVRYGPTTSGRLMPVLGELVGAQPLRAGALLFEVLGVLVSAQDGVTLATAGHRVTDTRPARSRVDAICSYMHDHYQERVALAEVAEDAHMSETALCRLFRRTVGKTVVGYLNELRVGHACRLLAETDGPITRIALASGFRSLSHFNRMFRRVRGCTPREYRRALSR
jgi:AraC-like DNA-binding protein